MSILRKVGILGGGQLGRMLLQEAANYPVETWVLENDPDCPAAHLCDRFIQGDIRDLETVLRFGRQVDVLTIEIEHVNVDALEQLEREGIMVIPRPSALRTIKNKILQKEFYLSKGIPTSPFHVLQSRAELNNHIGFLPAVQKLGTGGYDGKGVQLLHREEDLHKGFDAPSVLEKMVQLEKEVAISVAINDKGETAIYPAVEMIFDPDLNLLDYQLCPADISEKTGWKAEAMALAVARNLGSPGIFAVELRLDGPNRDLHSGLFGGAVDNPAMALAQMLASLRDKHGRVNIPGFYDDVAPLSKYERAMLAKLPTDEASFRKLVGAPALFGEKNFTSLERRTARPTCEINGLTSGYQGEGSKTIVPAWARAKLTFRLVPDMDPQKLKRLVVAHLKKLCPPSCKLTVDAGHAGEPYLVQPDSPRAQAALRALRDAFGCEPVLMREGGSIPIVNDFKRILGVETLLLGLSLPDDNAHSPNEKFDLDCFRAGMRMSARLWPELAKV